MTPSLSRDSLTWVEKYRPKYFSDFRGQEEAIFKIKNFVEEFNLGKITKRSKKALVLHGPPGVGKTTLAQVIANETNSEIFELNASDLRNKQNLQEVLRPALQQRSLIKRNKIILVDEVDGISAVDRGGLQELISLIANTHYPIIITANDIWNKKMSSLRQKSEVIQLKEIDYKIIMDILINILRNENYFLNPNVVKSIATRAKGDLRAAINDLQTFAKTRDPALLQIDERDKETDIFNALKIVFQGKPSKETLAVFDSVAMDLDHIILWIEENIPKEYFKKELFEAYERLSKVDIFKRRIYKQQYWRFMVYENILLSYGVSAAKKESKSKFTSYKKPTRILKMWMNNQRIAKRKTICQKYARYVHVGEKRALNEFPMFKVALQNPKVQKELKLTEEEIEYLKN